MSPDLNAFWSAGKLPIVNGILYADGHYQKIKILTDETNQRSLIPIQNTYLSDLSEYSQIIILEEYQSEDDHIFCGEGGYGGDGFVTVVSRHTNQILWAAFWEDANPFEKIELHENQLEITNNLYEVWQFDLSDAKHIKVSITKQSIYR